MNDLRITIAYMKRGELSRIGDSLKSDPSDDGPGWYARVTSDDGYTDHLKYAAISYATARQIGSLLGIMRHVDAVQSQAERDNEKLIAAARARIESDRALLRRLGSDA
jgi:hypothetical protein